MTEFIAYAKSKPGDVIYSSTGLYGSAHIAMAMLTRAADVRLIHSPFNGAGPARVALFADTPTLKEAGYDVDLMLWAGFFLPAKTPSRLMT